MREQKGLSQEQVAKAIGLSHRNYQRYESGDFPKFRSNKIKKLDELLGINIYDVLYDTSMTSKMQLEESESKIQHGNDFREKYIKLLEKRENEANLNDIWEAVQINQRILGVLYENLIEDSKKDKTLGVKPKKEQNPGT